MTRPDLKHNLSPRAAALATVAARIERAVAALDALASASPPDPAVGEIIQILNIALSRLDRVRAALREL